MDNKSQRQKLHFTERRKLEAADYIKGMTQAALAEKYGVAQATVSRDLEVIRQQWVESTLIDFHQAKARELAKVDRLEQEYWLEWEASKLERTKERTELERTGNISVSEGNLSVEGGGRGRRRSVEETQQRDGDPRYLAGVQWCIEQRCKLIGLYAPTQTEHSGPGGGAMQVEHGGNVMIYLPDNKRGNDDGADD